MKFLLTSPGIGNPSIESALVGLLGKPIALGVLELTALSRVREVAAGHTRHDVAIDDERAITAADGAVEVVSEGSWKLFTPSPDQP